jgi:WD40 repeat protein/transcriptional regulator with XRE-family HTH domain
MGRSLQGERDYIFGQKMLALRTSIGVTQEGLAALLGVTRKAIGRWEAGETYPNASHLQEILAFALSQRAFPVGEEEEAIRAFWQSAHQKMLLDEQWLQKVLNRQHPSLSRSREIPQRVEEKSKALPAPEQFVLQPQVDWGEAQLGPSFYGRTAELATLIHWIVEERCRVVSVLGLGGIGKSALSVQLIHQLTPHFEVVIWCSLRDAPSCEAILDQCLQTVAPQSFGVVPTSLEQRLELLLAALRRRRVLIVLDNLETVLEAGSTSGHMHTGYEGYDQLLKRVGALPHQSCLLFTSRESASEIGSLERTRAPVRSLRLAALDFEACEKLLAEKELAGSRAERTQLINAYAGNPLALTIVAQTIVDLFAGSIAPFLEQGEIVFGEIRGLLARQFSRLSLAEQTVLFWLAIMREPVGLDQLMALLVTPLSRGLVLEATQALLRRNLIERGQRPGSFTLQSVVMEYVTGQLVSEIASEIKQGQLARVIEHGLELTTVKEYIRQTQLRLIVTPLLVEVRSAYPEQAEVEERLLWLLGELRGRADYAQGYGPANFLTLLCAQRGHLRDLDLSRLSLREAFLQGVEMQDTSLAFAIVRDTVFTESFDAIRAVAVSPDGRFWATGSRRGKIQLWCEGGKILHLVWEAHTDTIRALAFSPDGASLATGSWDGTLKLWEVERGTLLWTKWLPTKIQRLAFAPNGQFLASGGGDASVRLWDTTSGTLVQTLPGQGSQIEALAWSPAGHFLASGSHNGGIQVWERPGEQVPVRVQLLAGHTGWVTGLAFAPDGYSLASGSVDQRVKLWEVESGRCLQTLAGHTQPVFALAWSSDGRLIASSGRDATIRLWDVEAQCYRAPLEGHEAGVYALTFTPDNRHLLSSSDDGTLRLWEVDSRQCIQKLSSYALSLYDVAWSPDGSRLASAGTDTLVTLWNIEKLASSRVLGGHSWVVHGVTWSPDGTMLASCSWDSTIRVWDATTGITLQIVDDPDHLDALIFGVAWSPDGKWLAGASTIHGVQVWEVSTGLRRWLGQTPAATRVVWSSDGKWLVSGGDDGNVCVWDAASGRLQRRLVGHQGMIKSVVWSPDSKYLASGCQNQRPSESGEIFVWDAASGQRTHSFSLKMGGVSALAWAASGERLISGSSDGMLRWWDVASGECVRSRKAHQGTIQSLKLSPTGSWLASCGDDGAIHLWEGESGEHWAVLRRDRPYERVDITGLRGLSESQKASLHTLGAFEATSLNGEYTLIPSS